MKLANLTTGLHKKKKTKLEHEKSELLDIEPQTIKKLKVEQNELISEKIIQIQLKPQNIPKILSSRDTFKILKGETYTDNWDIEIPKVIFQY